MMIEREKGGGSFMMIEREEGGREFDDDRERRGRERV